MFSCCISCISKEEERHRASYLVPVKSMSDQKDDAFTRSLESGTSFSHSSLLRESREDVYKKYEILEVLGQGSMGAVSKVKIKEGKIGGSAFGKKKKGLFGFGLLGRNKDSSSTNTALSERSDGDHVYALKSILLDRVSPVFIQELLNEVDILRSMDHPNIVKAHELYTYKKHIFLVLELCDGGDLYTRSPYSERESARHVASLLSAINYMHDHAIVHRDLKFENIMFEDNRPDAVIKVIDFGLSKKFLGQPGYMTERVGTIYTMAPQVLQGIYSSKADLWSVGVIAYMLLSASKPFYSRKRRKMIDLIMRCDYVYDAPVWKEAISADAKDFIDKLLVVDPKHRWDAAKALKHPWLVNREQLPDEKPSEAILMQVEDSLLNYRQTSALKKLALNVIAHRSSTKDIMELRAAFDAFDAEKDGIITYAEFKRALEKMNYSEETLKEIFASVDVNKNGNIMYTEFLAATIEAHGHIEEARIAEAFDRLDSDDSGFISRKNLREVLGKDCTAVQIDAIMKSADVNGDGRISYAEFLAAFRKETEVIADNIALARKPSDEISDDELVGLKAKIPGGRYDSDLSPSLQVQADRLTKAVVE